MHRNAVSWTSCVDESYVLLRFTFPELTNTDTTIQTLLPSANKHWHNYTNTAKEAAAPWCLPRARGNCLNWSEHVLSHGERVLGWSFCLISNQISNPEDGNNSNWQKARKIPTTSNWPNYLEPNIYTPLPDFGRDSKARLPWLARFKQLWSLLYILMHSLATAVANLGKHTLGAYPKSTPFRA